ncbi:MAG TPA: 50S ribosomal protein L18 [Patescibacteria group bacterium]|jgi:large subunit ribosomal protein L18|nr:50S ribosomal protein L18 [Patescibacteria group bacterium]
MNKLITKRLSHLLRKSRIRARVAGTAERPRLTVFISNRHVSAQIIDDSVGRTLASSATIVAKSDKGSMTEKAAWVGADVAKHAIKAGVKKVVFDRNGRQYQGRLNALAEAARKEGLEF